MFEKALENKGVQMMLANLIKGAAPDLIEHVDQFTAAVQAFDRRLAEVQHLLLQVNHKQDLIMKGNSNEQSGLHAESGLQHQQDGGKQTVGPETPA